MRTKWYVEFPLVLLTIIVAIIFAVNVQLPSCNKKPVPKTAANDATDKMTPDKQRWLEGKDIFKSNCAACHNPKTNGVGPALMGVTARWHKAGPYKGKSGEEWMRVWIHNWNDVVAADYKYGVDMANSRAPKMNTFPYLSDEQVDKILYYAESPDKYVRVVNPN
jgi:mono/diheme cytochrome c family protein